MKHIKINIDQIVKNSTYFKTLKKHLELELNRIC